MFSMERDWEDVASTVCMVEILWREAAARALGSSAGWYI
jgi:hypothetical protein